MTTPIPQFNVDVCPAVVGLKLLSGKWKPQIFRLAILGPVRFNSLLKQLPGINKQSLTVALRELEQAGFLSRQIITQKPLHIEYTLTDKGRSVLTTLHGLTSITVDDIMKGRHQYE